MRFRTNIQPQRRTRHKPQVGDVFTFHVPGKGWLFGRVVGTECQGGGCTLIYVYRIIQSTPKPVPMLDKRDLLFPPTFVFSSLWTQGYFVTVQEGPPKPGDLFDHHCFDNTFGRYVDENWKPVDGPFEPCGHTGIGGPVPFDNDVSDALGIPRVPDDQRVVRTEPPTGAKEGPGELTLYIPGEPGQRRLESIEAQIRGAVEASGAGTWEGHGFDLDNGVFDTRFQGKNRRKLLEAVRSAAASLKLGLPEGSYAVVRPRRGDWEERVEL